MHSKVSGTILEINVQEGEYIMEGSSLFKLADQLYSDEVKRYQNADTALVKLASYPNQTLRGKVTFLNPELTAASRVNIIRVQIYNEDLKYTAGMQAYVTLTAHEEKRLAVPMNALLREATINNVWVVNKEGNFEAKMVELGIQDNTYVEIKSGLHEADIVVTSGAYLLNSEYVFRNGSDPMAGMEM